jgi:hypothetical protein
MDSAEGDYEINDTFNYTGKIRDWLCCLKNKKIHGFTDWNRTVDISESDFYDAVEETSTSNHVINICNLYKKYDFIYICNKDDESCPVYGWNSIARNFELAKKCFPIMCIEFGLKGLIVGRENCDLEKKYGNKLEIIGWLKWKKLQEKMHECKFLFVPNIFDASPRVVAECITKNLQVLMNRNIMCGSKYITYETGELFTDEMDIRSALTNLLNKQYKTSPKKWWRDNYGVEKSRKALCDFLTDSFPGQLDSNVKHVKFIL